MKIIEIIEDVLQIEESFVKPEKLRRILMIRIPSHGDSIGQICVIGEINEDKCIFIEQSRMSFDGGAGGKSNIDFFKDWLDRYNLFGRVEKRLGHMTQESYEKNKKDEYFDRKVLFDGDSEYAKSTNERFQAWLSSDSNWKNK